VAINGFGRIGRGFVRASLDNPNIDVVAVNDLTSPSMLAHLLQYDSTQGILGVPVSVVDGNIKVGKDTIKVLAERSPSALPWADLKIDVVIESTGLFTSREAAGQHLTAGAKKVIISAPSGDADATIVMGVNEDSYDAAAHHVISNASCTTNCFVPMVKVLDDAFGIDVGLMTTVHAYTNDQVLTDVMHEDLRRARSATMSMIPTKTGAATAVGLVLPELNGKLDGYAIRVPTINVSIVDLSFISARPTTVEEVNAIMKEASEGALKGILAYNVEPLVSVDFNHNPASSTFDSTLTKVSGNLVKVSSWYDNEWGFSNRMLDTTIALMSAK
jgi:glyceraldehyde 3-phosphate dehydrogenase